MTEKLFTGTLRINQPASNHFLLLLCPVWVGPGRKPRKQFFRDVSQVKELQRHAKPKNDKFLFCEKAYFYIQLYRFNIYISIVLSITHGRVSWYTLFRNKILKTVSYADLDMFGFHFL